MPGTPTFPRRSTAGAAANCWMPTKPDSGSDPARNPRDLPACSGVYRRASLSNAGDRDNLLAHPEYLTWDRGTGRGPHVRR